MQKHQTEITEKGYTLLENVFSDEELESIINLVENADRTKATFRKSSGLFAIRQFLKEVPECASLIFNDKLRKIISNYFGKGCFVVKSIYFDKPEQSNWFVAYHQDLTISVDQKTAVEGYGPWTVKQNQFAVQPPLNVLENIYTIRIHLDDTDENNGALKVICGSHAKGIYRPETINWNNEKEETCNLKAGDVMIMKPLLLHSSGRTTNNNKRRVIHIELSDIELPEPLQWAERMAIL